MTTKYLDNTGLSYFWGKLKAFFAPKAHTHNAFETKHSYTTAANAAKNWYRIANANTSQTDTTKPIHAQFILTAYNTSYDAGYYERWFVNAEVFGRNAHIVILGNAGAPFSQARILYENTIANLDANDRPAIDIYLNYVLPNGTTKIEIEEVYNQGWTFVADGQISASTVPTGFESQACDTIRGNGVGRSNYSDWASYTSLQRSNFTANFTLADNNTYRARVLNCTGNITVTVPSINSVNAWFIIKNFNTGSGNITIHPSTTSVLIDGSNDDIILRPTEYIMIHSKAANAYTIVFDGRRRLAMVGRSGTVGSNPKHWFLVAETTCNAVNNDPYISFKVFIGSGTLHCGGVLTAHARINATKGVVASKELQWEYKNSNGLNLSDFAITHIDTSGTSTKIQVWCKLTTAYSHCKFLVISEHMMGDFSDIHTWKLTKARKTDGDIESLDTGFTGVATSTLLTIENSVSGNAATASAVAWSGVTNKPTTISGYGITDAKIANGTITLGSNSITPLTSVPSHNQASNTINAMTGYSKPSSGSAIATSDSLNSAIGKLEAKVDAVDNSNVVHKTDNETIAGNKTFNNALYFNDLGISTFRLKYGDDVNLPTTMPTANRYAGLGVYNSSGDVLLYDYHMIDPSNGNVAKVWKLQSSSDLSDSEHFEFIYNKANDSFYLTGPAEFSYTDSSSKIPNTAWLRNATGNFACNAASATKLKDARTISLTGDVSGSATFDGSANATITATVADDSHNHVISNVDGLQTALNGKAASSHTHGASDISSGTIDAARLPISSGTGWLRLPGNIQICWGTESISGNPDRVSYAKSFASTPALTVTPWTNAYSAQVYTCGTEKFSCRIVDRSGSVVTSGVTVFYIAIGTHTS